MKDETIARTSGTPDREASSRDDHPSAEAVADYLRDHPEFFLGRDALLADMILPHGNDGAISLVERQLQVLRERNDEMRRRLNDLVRNARLNHRIFERTLAITASLIEAADEGEAATLLLEGLRTDFDVDAAELHAIDGGDLAPRLAAVLPVTSEAVARDAVGNLMRPGRIICGVLRGSELAFLFGDAAPRVASAAVMLLEVPGGRLLIALGSSDADHFTPDMGTLFIRFLGDTLARMLRREGGTSTSAGGTPGAA